MGFLSFVPSASSSSLPTLASSSTPRPRAVAAITPSKSRARRLYARGWYGGAGRGGGGGRGGGDEDDEGDMERELSVLEAEQARIKAELEAARLKAQLAKLQQQQQQQGGGSLAKPSSSSKSRRGKERGRDDYDEDDDNASSGPATPRPPVSRRTGLQAAVPLSAKGPMGAAAAAKKKAEKAWGPPTEGRGGSKTSRATPSAGDAGLTDPDKEARYVEVVEELVSALQDVGMDSGVDIKTIVRGLKASRGENGLSLAAGGGGGGAPMMPPSKAAALFDEKQVLDAMRKGLGNALVKRIIDGGAEFELSSEEKEEKGGTQLERLAAWGSLVEKTISSSKYLLTAEKVLGMKNLADRLLPPEEFGGADVTVTHLAVVREVATKINEEYPEVRRRRGNMLYVLLNLPWASRGLGNVHQHTEEIAIGQGISMESSLGLGCRAVFESTMAETMPSSTEALSLMQPESFRRTTRALLEFGGLARQVLGLTRMPAEDALKGVAFFLIPWLRRVAKRALEGGDGEKVEEGVARLGMVMEMGRYAAEAMALARGFTAASDPVGFERAVQDLLNEKINGIGVELSSGVRYVLRRMFGSLSHIHPPTYLYTCTSFGSLLHPPPTCLSVHPPRSVGSSLPSTHLPTHLLIYIPYTFIHPPTHPSLL